MHKTRRHYLSLHQATLYNPQLTGYISYHMLRSYVKFACPLCFCVKKTQPTYKIDTLTNEFHSSITSHSTLKKKKVITVSQRD